MFFFLALLGASLADVPVAVEGGISTALPRDHLGVGPGARLVGEAGLTDNLWLGAEGRVRLPGGADVRVRAPNVAEPVDLRTGQTVFSLGARISWTPGDPEKVRLRLAGTVGGARLTQSVVGEAGTSREGIGSVWLQPEVGVLADLGPGSLTGGLYWFYAPAQLDILRAGGSAVGLVVGWRVEFGERQAPADGPTTDSLAPRSDG